MIISHGLYDVCSQTNIFRTVDYMKKMYFYTLSFFTPWSNHGTVLGFYFRPAFAFSASTFLHQGFLGLPFPPPRVPRACLSRDVLCWLPESMADPGSLPPTNLMFDWFLGCSIPRCFIANCFCPPYP